MASQRYRWFIVRNEGGVFEFIPYLEWRKLRKSVPIFGIRAGSKLWIYDRILARMGCKPLRTRRWEPMSDADYQQSLIDGQHIWAPKWPDAYARLGE